MKHPLIEKIDSGVFSFSKQDRTKLKALIATHKCEWTKYDYELMSLYRASCGSFGTSSDFKGFRKYCPYCAGEIKVKDG